MNFGFGLPELQEGDVKELLRTSIRVLSLCETKLPRAARVQNGENYLTSANMMQCLRHTSPACHKGQLRSGHEIKSIGTTKFHEVAIKSSNDVNTGCVVLYANWAIGFDGLAPINFSRYRRQIRLFKNSNTPLNQTGNTMENVLIDVHHLGLSKDGLHMACIGYLTHRTLLSSAMKSIL